jgi:hypothetical protein
VEIFRGDKRLVIIKSAACSPFSVRGGALPGLLSPSLHLIPKRVKIESMLRGMFIRLGFCGMEYWAVTTVLFPGFKPISNPRLGDDVARRGSIRFEFLA